MHDIYICYQNNDSQPPIAYQIRDFLKGSYRVYCNIDQPNDLSGKQRQAIDKATDFVIVLTPGCLRAVNDNPNYRDQYVSAYQYALETKKNIIPVYDQNFTWNTVPPSFEQLPVGVSAVPYMSDRLQFRTITGKQLKQKLRSSGWCSRVIRFLVVIAVLLGVSYCGLTFAGIGTIEDIKRIVPAVTDGKNTLKDENEVLRATNAKLEEDKRDLEIANMALTKENQKLKKNEEQDNIIRNVQDILEEIEVEDEIIDTMWLIFCPWLLAVP